MLDIKRIRNNPEEIKRLMANRGETLDLSDIDRVVALDEERRQILVNVEADKSRRNQVSAEIPKLKKAGQDTSAIMAEMKALGDDVRILDQKVKDIDAEIEYIMLRLPNIPNELVPDGATDADNIEIKRWGEPKVFGFDPKAHWDIGTDLDILDFERAGKITGSRFTILKGFGSSLERAVINYYLDTHTEYGYKEIFPPFMVNRTSMTGTGQLPKFEEDAFKVTNDDYFLIPTAEVPVTNMYRDETFSGDDLPLKHVAYSACFRAEAGSAGRDTRGLIRQHQFNKVELVKFALPETSYAELETLLANAETILRRLGLAYRVVTLCTGDLGFSAAKTYDIEVWMPAQQTYREISSCSNFEDFQARRADIRLRRKGVKGTELVHTLNGSGLAVGRTVAAICENCQQADGTVRIPEALRPYMGGMEVIAP